METILIPLSGQRGAGLGVLVDADDAVRLGARRLSISSSGYAQGWFGYVDVLHRWLMGCVRGDGTIVDHVNRVPLDCRRQNLRFVTPGESSANRGPSRHSTSGYRGVTRKRNKWAAKVKVGGKTVGLGVYSTAEEAGQIAQAYRLEHLVGAID